jgi:DNA-binding GntR family transcriptional regulator
MGDPTRLGSAKHAERLAPFRGQRNRSAGPARAASVTLVRLERPSPCDTAAEALRQDVLSGFLPPGTALPDSEVMERLGVTRALARGALAQLETEGLVVHSLHRGVEVSRLSVEDVRDLYATRRTLELAGLEAMIRRRPADDVWLQAAVESMTQATRAGDGRAAVAADAAFHLALVASTSSRRLRTAAEAAMRELRVVLAVADRVASDLDELAADHAALLDVLVYAPAPSARAALLDHLRRGEARALAVTHGA